MVRCIFVYEHCRTFWAVYNFLDNRKDWYTDETKTFEEIHGKEPQIFRYQCNTSSRTTDRLFYILSFN